VNLKAAGVPTAGKHSENSVFTYAGLNARDIVPVWRKSMKRVGLGIIFAVGLTAVAAWSQTAVQFYETVPLTPNSKIQYATPLENDASRTVQLATNTYPPLVNGACAADAPGCNFHRHFGDQWNTVMEGELTFTIKGQPPRTLKVGDAVYIPRGAVHRNRNLTDKPARTVELLIMDKDKPILELVAE
jgi:mannose-6-phosphate isomerase-like protein (cupin superfamily)